MSSSKVLSVITIVLVVCAFAIVFFESTLAPPTPTPRELDFTVSGSNDCLRFLNSTVSTVYVPVATGANQRWEITVNCTKMPGGANGWTDVYIYKGYWDKGVNHVCNSSDIYPILGSIESANAQITANKTYTRTFGGSVAESYTVFFIFPPGGQATFHLVLKQAV